MSAGISTCTVLIVLYTLPDFRELFLTLDLSFTNHITTHSFVQSPADSNFVSKQTEPCAHRVSVWMESNRCKLNGKKMMAMEVGGLSGTRVSGTLHTEMGGSSVLFRPKVEGLGVVAGPAVMYI